MEIFIWFRDEAKGHGGALICLNAMKGYYQTWWTVYAEYTDHRYSGGRKWKSNRCKKLSTMKQKEEIEVECESVIIASSGIMEDREMMKNTGFTFTDYNCSGDGNVLFNCYPNSGQTGDGQKLAWKLGGAQSAIAVSGHNLVPDGNRGKFSVDCIQRDTYHSRAAISVGKQKNGERFIDESISNNHMAIQHRYRQISQMGKVISYSMKILDAIWKKRVWITCTLSSRWRN